MNSNTTVRRPITESRFQIEGRPVSEWREIAMRAASALRRNPRDAGAQATLESVKPILQEFVQGPLHRNLLAGDVTDAEAVNRSVGGFSVNALNAATMGADQNIMNTIGQGDAYAAYRDLAGETQPMRSLLGQVTGSSIPTTAATRFAGRAAPQIIRGILPGLEASAAPAQIATTSLAGGLALGIPSAIGGAMEEQGDLPARLQRAASEGGGGFILGASLAGLGGYATRAARLGHAERLAQLNRAAQSEAELAAAQGRAIAAPARVTSAENQAALSTARVEDIPVVRANRAAGQGRAAAAAERAVVAEPDIRQGRQLRNVLLQAKVDRMARMRGVPASQRAAMETPAGVEAETRGFLARQGYSQEFIDKVIERGRGLPGSGLAPRAPTAAEVDRIGTAPEIPAFIQSPAASTQAEAAALPGTYRPTAQRGPSEAWLQRRNQILGIGQQTPSGVPVSGTGSNALDAGRALQRITQQPFSDDLAARIAPVLQSATAAERQSLLVQVMMGRENMQPEWVSFLRGILRSQ